MRTRAPGPARDRSRARSRCAVATVARDPPTWLRTKWAARITAPSRARSRGTGMLHRAETSVCKKGMQLGRSSKHLKHSALGWKPLRRRVSSERALLHSALGTGLGLWAEERIP